jgi:hypothetical protein
MKSREHFYNLNPLLILSFNNPELLPKIVLNNTVIIDKSMNWSLLQYKDALHILRQKTKLNHGNKASKELPIFNEDFKFLTFRVAFIIPDDDSTVVETLN